MAARENSLCEIYAKTLPSFGETDMIEQCFNSLTVMQNLCFLDGGPLVKSSLLISSQISIE